MCGDQSGEFNNNNNNNNNDNNNNKVFIICLYIILQVEQWCPMVIPKRADWQEVCTIPSDSAFPNCGSKVKVSV